MSGVLVSMIFGLGVYYVWSSFWPEPTLQGSKSTVKRTDRLEELLVQSGWQRTLRGGKGARIFLLVSAALGLFTLLIVFALTRGLGLAVLAAGFVTALPLWTLRSVARRRVSQRSELWPDVVDNLRSAIRAGLALPEAVSQLEVNGPEPLRPQFGVFATEYRLSGKFAHSLDVLKNSFADPVADRIIESLRMARDVGGSDLGTLLHALSHFLRDELRTRAELHARQSWTINAAKLAVAAPWLVLLMMGTRAQSLSAFNSPQGTLVLLLGALMCFGAYRVMKHIARLPDDERVLR